jgi:hypothetical protein
MKNLISVIAIFICLHAASQDIQFEYGPIRAIANHPGGSGAFKELAFQEMTPEDLKMLGAYGDRYFVIRGKYLLILDNSFNCVDSLKISNAKVGRATLYYDALIINKKLVLFYVGTSEEVERGNRGIFIWEMDLSTLTFKDPRLLEQFPYENLDRVEIKMSDNREYFSISVVNQENCSELELSMAVFNKDLEKLVSETSEDITVEKCYMYNSSYLSNTGKLYLLFDKSSGDYNAQYMQNQLEYAACLFYGEGVSKKFHEIALPDREVSYIQVMEINNVPTVFISWFYEDESSRTGISQYDLNSGEEKLLCEFEAGWIEPFVHSSEQQFYDEKEKLNSLNKSSLNASYHIVSVNQLNNTTTYVIEKKKEVFIVIGDRRTPRIFKSDIILLYIDENGTIVKKSKNERSVLSGYFSSGLTSHQKDSQLHIMYYSVNPDQEKRPYTNNTADYKLCYIHVDLETLTEKNYIVATYGDKTGDQSFRLFLDNVHAEPGGFITYGLRNLSERVVRVKY